MAIKICIGADHGGFETKKVLIDWLLSKSVAIKDYGTNSSESVDYPVYAHLVSKAIQRNEFDFGILICGSGQGMALTANKYRNIRAALCWDKSIAALSRQHNNSNILVLPGRFINDKEAIEIAETFLTSAFEGGRHQKRVDMIVQNLQSAKTILNDGLSIRNRSLKLSRSRLQKIRFVSKRVR